MTAERKKHAGRLEQRQYEHSKKVAGTAHNLFVLHISLTTLTDTSQEQLLTQLLLSQKQSLTQRQLVQTTLVQGKYVLHKDKLHLLQSFNK